MLSGHLSVSGGHQIYYEKHGARDARPVVVLHGGPGGGMNRIMLQSFDLNKWCVVLFDQRGCGKSTPFGSLEHNTTWDLVDDIESLRTHFGWDSWFVTGGSWGTTLALAYAETHPSRVTGLLLRGVCLCDDDSFRWLYQEGGASEIFPDTWKGFLSVLPKRLHTADWLTIARYYQKGLKGPHAQRFANAWWKWESSVSFLLPKKDDAKPKEALALALLENHYFVNGCWLKKDQLLKGLHKLRHIPFTIIHGRYDLVCPISASFAIKDALPHVKLCITPDGGHAFAERGTTHRFKDVARTMRRAWPLRSVRRTQKKARE